MNSVAFQFLWDNNDDVDHSQFGSKLMVAEVTLTSCFAGFAGLASVTCFQSTKFHVVPLQ